MQMNDDGDEMEMVMLMKATRRLLWRRGRRRRRDILMLMMKEQTTMENLISTQVINSNGLRIKNGHLVGIVHREPLPLRTEGVVTSGRLGVLRWVN